MSISSFESFICGPLIVDVKEKKYSLEIGISHNAGWRGRTGVNLTSTSSTVHVHPGEYQHGALVVDGAQNYMTTNVSANYQTIGFKLFIKDGLLKCIKREVAYYSIVTTASVCVSPTMIPKQHIKETFCPVNQLVQGFDNPLAMGHIQGKILSIAEKKGIKVPEKFVQIGAHYSGSTWVNFYSSFDWLAYPFLRELDSPEICRNIHHHDRALIAPIDSPLNFKDLVKHYYGASTNKMLEEIWKVITVSVPGKGINPLVFTLGPTVFKVMGFDYFYQAIPFLAASEATRNVNMTQFDLRTLVDYIGPKKALNILFGPGLPVTNFVQDTAQMLTDYNSVEKIPPSLKDRYPNGIEVNFKFKTLEELHDKISLEYTLIKGEADKKPIPVHAAYLKLDGMEKDGLKLVVPTNTIFLKMWGSALSICVASYGERAADGNTLILGVEKDGMITYCLEFKPILIARIDQQQGDWVYDNNVFDPKEAPIIREALPMLEERHHIVPADVDNDMYLLPYVQQFRSKRNGDPTPEDRNAVLTMLANWVEENKEEYDKLGEKAMYKDSYKYNIHYGQQEPNQLLVNPQAYQAFQRIIGNPANIVVDDGV